MGGRLTTATSSISSSSATAHRPGTSGSTTNLAHQRAFGSSGSNSFHRPTGRHRHRHRSSSNHHHHHHPNHQSNPQAALGNQPTHHGRNRAISTNGDPIGTTPFNLSLLRYVGLEHDSEDQSSDDDSPHTHRRLQHFLFALRDVTCPVCNKTIPRDIFEKHIVQCLAKPRIDYNEDTLTEEKGECVICLEDLLVGQKIARLPCLCIYHKSCIDSWFRINRTCPEHPGD